MINLHYFSYEWSTGVYKIASPTSINQYREKLNQNYVQNKYLKLKSYGMICTNCERGSFFLSSSNLMASFPSSLGNWRQIQSINDSKSFAKFCKYQSKSFGIANLDVEIPTVACKYSLLATSSSFSTWDAV